MKPQPSIRPVSSTRKSVGETFFIFIDVIPRSAIPLEDEAI
jgi:hypothetical protein